jgi:aspartate kinase
VPVHVRSSFSDRPGSWVVDDHAAVPPGLLDPPDVTDPTDGPNPVAAPQEDPVEQPIISGVAHDRSEAKITVVGVPDVPGKAAAIFQAVADAGVNIDMIVQNVSAGGSGRTDVSFTLPKSDGQAAMSSLQQRQAAVGYEGLIYNDQIGKVSMVGAGMRSHPGVSARFFTALSEAGVNIEMISTSEIRISVVTRAEDLDTAVRAVHSAFALDADSVEAVVYAGTGR